MKYSQNSEEQHIARIVGDNPGYFLDIGAYNPKLFSNTRALYERGWSGVMIEPAPGPFLDLLIEYGHSDRVQLVCAAVAMEPGLIRFEHSESGVATANLAHYQKWRDKATFDGQFYACGITPGELSVKFGMSFDFIDIDVEGNSAELFIAMLLTYRFRPKCWCVEHDGRQEELTRYALREGYVQEHINGENVIYARQSG